MMGFMKQNASWDMVGEVWSLDNGVNQRNSRDLIQRVPRDHKKECMKVLDFVGTSDCSKHHQKHPPCLFGADQKTTLEKRV